VTSISARYPQVFEPTRNEVQNFVAVGMTMARVGASGTNNDAAKSHGVRVSHRVRDKPHRALLAGIWRKGARSHRRKVCDWKRIDSRPERDATKGNVAQNLFV